MGECLAFPANIEGDDSPLIPEGVYELGYVDHSTWMFMGRQPKVVIWFSVIDLGDYFGLVIPAYYNVDRFIGRRGRNGGFKARKKSNLVRDFYRVFPHHALTRLDRIPLSKFETVVIQGTVETVKQGYDQRAIPEPVQYSIVKRIEI